MSSDSECGSQCGSECSPNTHRWNKIEHQLNDIPATTKDEMRQKLKQKIQVKQMRRLGRDAQEYKLNVMRQQMNKKPK